MSRSRRKTPIAGVATSDSEKDDKRKANRRERRVNRILLRTRGEEALKDRRAVSNVWSFAKDGKIRFDPKKEPGLLRK